MSTLKIFHVGGHADGHVSDVILPGYIRVTHPETDGVAVYGPDPNTVSRIAGRKVIPSVEDLIPVVEAITMETSDLIRYVLEHGAHPATLKVYVSPSEFGLVVNVQGYKPAPYQKKPLR